MFARVSPWRRESHSGYQLSVDVNEVYDRDRCVSPRYQILLTCDFPHLELLLDTHLACRLNKAAGKSWSPLREEEARFVASLAMQLPVCMMTDPLAGLRLIIKDVGLVDRWVGGSSLIRAGRETITTHQKGLHAEVIWSRLSLVNIKHATLSLSLDFVPNWLRTNIFTIGVS